MKGKRGLIPKPKGWWYHRETTVSVAEDLSHSIELTDLMVDRQKAFYCIWSAKCQGGVEKSATVGPLCLQGTYVTFKLT